MNREDLDDDLIELGNVTAETRGVSIGFDDQESGRKPALGLSDD